MRGANSAAALFRDLRAKIDPEFHETVNELAAICAERRRLDHQRRLYSLLHNWVWVHGALRGRTPAMAMRLTDRIWTVLDYIRYPVHVDDLVTAADERRGTLQIENLLRLKTEHRVDFKGCPPALAR